MNKWIYSSIVLNIYAFISFVSITFTWKPFWDIMLDDGTGRGGIIGFVLAPTSLLCTITLLILYLLELIIHKLVKKYTFSFPYQKIKHKIPYFIYFYIGILWTTWLGFLCILTLPLHL